MEQYFDSGAPLYVAQRFLHDCSKGKDPCLIVTRFPSHFKWFCHRCGRSGIHKIENLPPGEVLKMWAANRIQKDKPKQTHKIIRLPMDFTNDVKMYSPEAYAWLMFYGITDEEIVKYNIGYSHYYNRVIFPVYWKDELVYWQGRTMDAHSKENPKWLNIKLQGREDIYFYAGATGMKIVLVEDILSAIKVGRVMECIALLGSYIPDNLIRLIKHHEIYIWLDEDKRADAVKYYLQLQCRGMMVRLRVTSKDPKSYTEEEIRRKIG